MMMMNTSAHAADDGVDDLLAGVGDRTTVISSELREGDR